MSETAPPPLAELALEYEYETPRALPAFYVPVLSRAIRYDRTCGYFRASSLSIAAQGVARFVRHGGRMRLLCGVELAAGEIDALQGDASLPPAIERRLKEGLVSRSDIEAERLGVLAWLVREGRLEIQLAVPTASGSSAYFHEKKARFEDAHGNVVCTSGSNNETATGWQHNFESFWVRASWKESPEAMHAAIASIEQRFEGELPNFRRVPLSDDVVREFVRLAPDDPPTTDVAEPPQRPSREAVARFLQVAPKLSNSAATLTATSAVTPFPHQATNVERLAGGYPRSWLLADEVGLGKTVSAGLTLRQLLLSGQVKRVLILAPANVCVQWQDELFEKFGLWVPRYSDGKLFGAHPDDVKPVTAAANPYAEHDVLIVSSHLARLDAQRLKLLQAPTYDLMIVDEAHHARRKGADPRKREATKLLRLLDDVRAQARTRALWLLTATPMQVDPVELYDLLCHVADDQAVIGDTYEQFSRFYRQIAQPTKLIAWPFLAKRVAAMPTELDAAELGALGRIERRIGAYRADTVRSWAAGADPHATAQGFDDETREELVAFLRQRGPVARYVLRSGRGTLKRYRAAGLLREPIAEREIRVRTIQLTPVEEGLYAELDDLIDRLTQAHGTTQAAGFILTTYRRRLTSSWAAIRESLLRRIEAEEAANEESGGVAAFNDDELADELDDVTGQAVNPTSLLLTADEIEEMLRFVNRIMIAEGSDSKLDALLADIAHARKTGRPIIVFTQYTDTLNALRERLTAAYGAELAQYTGEGGRWFGRPAGEERVTKQDLVDAVRSGSVTVLLCTDAASEGLNLQAASKLINYDLPWNPMRVEQRIGRIDRIGQQAETVEIVNYTIPGTVEEDVYRALAAQIDSFDDLVGELQPILGAVESSFKTIYRAPRSERAKVVKEQIDAIDARTTELRKGGVGLDNDHELARPVPVVPAVDLEGLAHALRDDLRIDLDALPHPTTAEPRRASRDIADWRALATFGHPDLAVRLAELAEAEPHGLAIEERPTAAAMARADRVPPEAVLTLGTMVDIDDIESLGDARALARATVDAMTAAQAEALCRWDRHRLERQRGELLRTLEQHLHRMMELQALSSGHPPSSELWSALRSRPTPKACQELPKLLKLVGLSAAEVIENYTPSNLEVRNAAFEMRQEATALKAWMQAWARVAAS